MIPPNSIFRWSFSQWETYNECPAKWKFQNVLKLPRKPPGPAAARGSDIHGSIERYILGAEADQIHPAVKKKYIPIFDELRNHLTPNMYVEKKLGVDKNWNICAPSSPLAAAVCVLDGVRVDDDNRVLIYEWKSGKPKDTHLDQRKLYVMFGVLYWQADYAEATTFYLEDTGPPQKLVLSSKDGFGRLQDLWDQRIDTMKRDEMCAPKPQFSCRWCDYRNSAGGPCQFG